MRFPCRRPILRVLIGLLFIGVSSTTSSFAGADSPKDDFVKRWKASRVVVKQVLYTLIFAERGLVGNMSNGKRAGLNVVTPFDGVYFQFDGRGSEEDVIERDPRRIPDAITTKYLKTAVLDVGTYPKIEALSLERYETGVTLIVSAVRIERDTVRLMFRNPAGEIKSDTATTLTVKWPLPLSKSLSEVSAIENLIRQFVDLQNPKN